MKNPFPLAARALCLALAVAPCLAAEEPSAPSFDFGAAPDTKVELTENLKFGADITAAFEATDNYDLDDGDDDHLRLIEPELRAALLYDPRSFWYAFGEFQVDGRAFLSKGPENDESSRGQVRIRQIYVMFPEIFPGAALQVGRQRYKDARAWWYDERIDAVRLFWQTGPFGVELSAAREKAFPDDLLRDETDDRADFFMLVGRYAIGDKSEINGFIIHKDDHERDIGESPIFFGIQSVGRFSSDFRYWLNAAHVRGSARRRDLDAFGADLGFSYRFDHKLDPFITLGVAYGSGDADRNEGKNNNFRQTGLQDNESRTFGITSYNVYGEVADFELSNMWIYTAGIGMRPSRKASVELLYHKYVQVDLDNNLLDTDLEEEPQGDNDDLGQALDLVAAYRPMKDLKLSFILGAFMPGDGFNDNEQDVAYLAKFKFSYGF